MEEVNVNNVKGIVLKATTAGALTLLLASSGFAATPQGRNSRDDNSRRQDQTGNRSNGNGRGDQRVNMSGRVTSLSHERDGYRVNLDRDQRAFWIPSARIGRGTDLRVGVSIVLGGIFRGGRVEVDAVSWPGGRDNGRYDNGGYDNGRNNNGRYDNGRYDDRYDSRSNSIQGVITSVDTRRGTVWLRDDNSGRGIEVDMRGTQRSSRIDMNDLRRGDRVTISGDWQRGGIFDAYAIESVRTRGRY
jgi:hypothetical protein